MEDVFVLTADVMPLEFSFDVDVEMPEMADIGLDETTVENTPAEPPVIEEPVWISLAELRAIAEAHPGPFAIGYFMAGAIGSALVEEANVGL